VENVAVQIPARQPFFFLLFTQHNIHHHFAGCADAHLHGSQKAMMFPYIIKRKSIIISILTDAVADVVGQVVLQPAFLYIYYFIKKAFCMKARYRPFITAFIFPVKTCRPGGILLY
jgi:hypothetical protein